MTDGTLKTIENKALLPTSIVNDVETTYFSYDSLNRFTSIVYKSFDQPEDSYSQTITYSGDLPIQVIDSALDGSYLVTFEFIYENGNNYPSKIREISNKQDISSEKSLEINNDKLISIKRPLERYYYDLNNNLIKIDSGNDNGVTELTYDLEKQGFFRHVNLPSWFKTFIKLGANGYYCPNLPISEKENTLLVKYKWLNFQANYPTQVTISVKDFEEVDIYTSTITYKEKN